MWGEQVAAALPTVLSSVGEVAALAGGVRGLPAAVRAPRAATVHPAHAEPAPSRTTVPTLLIHGYLGSTLVWSPLIAHLHRDGIGGLFTFRYNSLASSVETVARQLHLAAHEVLDRTGADRVNIVGHSLGGLVARFAVQRLGLDEVTNGVVTIATPHRGSAFAYAALGPAGVQMRPGARLIADLPPLATTAVHWLVIEAALDPVAPHVDHEGVPLVVLPTRGHQGILREPCLARALTQHLLASEPARAVA